MLQAIHISRFFGDKILFQDLSFQLPDGERVGLVGDNGSGKTTLLHLLAGLDVPDQGEIRVVRRQRIGLLDLSPVRNPAGAAGSVWQSPSFQTTEPDTATSLVWQQEQTGLVRDLPRQGQWSTLSGGERTRLALSRFLADPPDIFLLDEPTNNLDLAGIQTVIRQLASQSAAMVIVSHDRYLLDCLVTRIVEIDYGQLVEYQGNYSFYRQEKERLFQERLHRFEEGRKQQRQIQDAIRQTREWAEKGHRNSTKPDASGLTMGVKEKKRARAMKKDKKAKNDIQRLERLIQASEVRPKAEKTVRFDLAHSEKQGRRIMEAVGLAKSFGPKQLFGPSDFYLLRGEKAALLGPNGSGKSTLIHLIQHHSEPDQGRIWVSPGARIGILGQELEPLPAHLTLQAYLVARLGRLDADDRSQLAQLGLSKHHLAQTCDTFSLGEQMKIKLVELILFRHDFLILDEPTNYLDLHAREQLEQTLQHFPGTLLIVSHDARLLENICDKVLVIAGQRISRQESGFREFFAEKVPGTKT